jgi:serine/threonine protein phosphatase PrpC
MLLLLCSDGLSDVLSATEIENVLRGPGTLRSKGEGLINEAINRNPGCGDNITIIFVEIER